MSQYPSLLTAMKDYPSYTPQYPVPSMPQLPQIQDVDKAMKFYSWFSSSGLTAEELDALASMKRSGKDIDAYLGITKTSDTLTALKKDIDELRKLVSNLSSKISSPEDKK